MDLHPSISLLINCHASEIGLLDINLQSELNERVEVAYKITTNTFNHIEDKDYNVLKKEYFDIPIEHQRSNEKIMDLFLENCLLNAIPKRILNSNSYTEPNYKPVINSTLRMIDEDRRCYRGHSVVDRLYYFDDIDFYKKFKVFQSVLRDNTPFMGNMYVLRATFLDGTIEQGDLLQSVDLINSELNEIRQLVQTGLLANKKRIKVSDLLTILKSKFNKIYIYDFGCRARTKNFNLKVNPEYPDINPLLSRQLTNFVYNSERKPYVKRVFSRAEQDFNRELFDLIITLFNKETNKLINEDGTKFKDIHEEKTFIDLLESKNIESMYPEKDPIEVKEHLAIVLKEFFRTKEWMIRAPVPTSEILENIKKIYLEMIRLKIVNESDSEDEEEQTLFSEKPQLETFMKYFDSHFFNKKYSIYEDFSVLKQKYQQLIYSFFDGLL